MRMHTQYTVLHMYLQKGSVVMGFYNGGQNLPVLVGLKLDHVNKV